MHLHHWPFQWPRQCARAIQTALLDAACPGLPWKPLDTAIGQLLALYCPSGLQGNSNQNDDKKMDQLCLAILMAPVVHRYDSTHIAWWKRSRALVEATGCCHQASIAANSCNWSHIRRYFFSHSSSTCRKRSWVNSKAPVFNGCMTYQMKEKGLTKVSI